MIRWASLLCCFALVGCSFSADQCFEDADCPEGQTCVLRSDVLLCLSPFVPVTNNGLPDVGLPDTPLTGPDVGTQLACNTRCEIDGFEPNDDQEAATLLTVDRYGCSRGILTEEKILRSASLCDEDIDWYEVLLRPCEDRSFILNVDITPTTACGLEGWEIWGDVWSCDSPTVSCISNDQGRRVRFLISSALGESFALRFAARSSGAMFDYDIRVAAED